MNTTEFNPIRLSQMLTLIDGQLTYRQHPFVPEHLRSSEVKIYTDPNDQSKQGAYVVNVMTRAAPLIELISVTSKLTSEQIASTNYTQEVAEVFYRITANHLSLSPADSELLYKERDSDLCAYFQDERAFQRVATKSNPEQHKFYEEIAVKETATHFCLTAAQTKRILVQNGALVPTPKDRYNPLADADPAYKEELNQAKLEARRYYTNSRGIPIAIDVKTLCPPDPAKRGTRQVPTHCPYTGEKLVLRFIWNMGLGVNDLVIGRKSVDELPQGSNLVVMSRIARSVIEGDKLATKVPRWAFMSQAQWDTYIAGVRAQWRG